MKVKKSMFLTLYVLHLNHTYMNMIPLSLFQMGNGIRKLNHCFSDTGDISRRHDIAILFTKSNFDEGLGHSFCYIRPDPYPYSRPEPYLKTTTFSCISGASVSANTWTPLSTSSIDLYMYGSFDRASSFESSALFASIPLQPVPRGDFSPRKSVAVSCSGPIIERGFLSGPIERGFVSGPIDKSPCSGSVEKVYDPLQTGLPSDELVIKSEPGKRKLMKNIRKVITKTLSRGRSKSMKSDGGIGNFTTVSSSTNLSSQVSLNCDDDECFGDDDESSRRSQNLQWAQGKAGEDRVHIVVSEDNGWVFVGIYDGFNGPDAPDFLLTNLYSAVHKELNELLWNDKAESKPVSVAETEELDQSQLRNSCSEPENQPSTSGISDSKFELEREKSRHDSNSKQQLCSNHDDVLKALSRALKKTEAAYLEIADRMLVENPELALMGSCVLAMLMKGEDVYLMNVGDSRAVLAQQSERDVCPKKYTGHDLDGELHTLSSLQLTLDHSTNVKEEVRRIRREHPNDACAVMNDRVKGSLKVTRAFGAGFLKQPKWNDALLEVFRIDYVGDSPYINCNPFLCHHKLGLNDRFLILSSDGLYQYFTNQEAVSKVELFMDSCPEGDPAQHLIEEVLFRAAKEAGMDFHELLEIPQGDRRKFHDDVSIIIISLEGRIWRSSV